MRGLPTRIPRWNLLLLNVMLRSIILYAHETYYKLKEGEIRQMRELRKNV